MAVSIELNLPVHFKKYNMTHYMIHRLRNLQWIIITTYSIEKYQELKSIMDVGHKYDSFNSCHEFGIS